MRALCAVVVALTAAVPARAQFAGLGGDLGAQLDAIQEGSAALGQSMFQEASLRRHKPRGRRHVRRHRNRVPPPVAINPSTSRFPVRGIDVSGYQDQIDWAQVAQAPAGYAFAYIRAAHGLDADEQFAKNWAGAQANGLRVGAYHFYDMCEDATEQARLFVETVPRTAGALPEVVDIETSKECPKMPPKEEFLKDLKIFTDLFEITYGRRPMLYVNGDIYKNYFAGDDVPNKIWFADPRREPALSDGRAWDFWQYAWTGRVPGINDNKVDFDVFNGTRADFDAAFPAPTTRDLADSL